MEEGQTKITDKEKILAKRKELSKGNLKQSGVNPIHS
jgi:hypothetical protein